MNEIPDEHVLPHDFCCYHMRFRKGVKLEVVRQAAERWLKEAIRAHAPRSPSDLERMRDALRPLMVGEDRPELPDQTTTEVGT